jgi:hypothetical protein
MQLNLTSEAEKKRRVEQAQAMGIKESSQPVPELEKPAKQDTKPTKVPKQKREKKKPVLETEGRNDQLVYQSML